jgi:hypothetical protein
MKIIAYSVLAVLIWSLVSCIPSLHGIATPENRVINDAIVGLWSGDEIDTTLIYTPPKRTANEVTLSEEAQHISKDLYWKFERAIRIEGIYDNSKLNYNEISPSLVPEKVEIRSKELLPYYILTHSEIIDDDIITNHMKVELTKINGHLLMDFTPYERMSKERRTRFATNYVEAHTFAKLIVEGMKITILPLHGDYVYDLIQKKRIRLKHEFFGEDNDVVLTASTEELRAFITNYSHDTNLFDEPEVLQKIMD